MLFILIAFKQLLIFKWILSLTSLLRIMLNYRMWKCLTEQISWITYLAIRHFISMSIHQWITSQSKVLEAKAKCFSVTTPLYSGSFTEQ